MSSVFIGVFEEELDRLNRMEAAYRKNIDSLPKGYISKKIIRGNINYYLQWRENGKMKSKYISKELLEEYKLNIERRKHFEKQIKEIEEDKKRIRRVLK